MFSYFGKLMNGKKVVKASAKVNAKNVKEATSKLKKLLGVKGADVHFDFVERVDVTPVVKTLAAKPTAKAAAPKAKK